MAKNTDTVLRIRAQNLATKDLREVSGELDKLAAGQKKNASASDLAARSIRDLTTEQKNLATLAAELNRRGGVAGNLVDASQRIAATTAKVAELKSQLEQLKNVKVTPGTTGVITKSIKETEKALRQANAQLTSQTNKFHAAEAAAAKIGVTSQNAATSIAAINTEVARTKVLMNEAAAATQRYDAAVHETQAALVLQEATQRAITAEAQRRNVLEGVAASQRTRQAAEEMAQLREQARIREELTKRFLARPLPVTSGLPVHAPGGDTASAAMAAGLAREVAFRERLVAVLRKQKDGGEKLLANDGKLAAATRRVTAALQEQNKSLDRTNKLTGIFGDTGRKSLSVYQRMRGQILSTAAAYVGLYQAVHLVASAITVQQERKRIVTQLGIANNGDIKAAARDVTFLREQADRLGLVYEDVARNFANYKIAARSVGASNNTIKKSFSDATEIVTGLGLSADDAEGVFRAFVQILGKARVQAEELRGQLGDRLPGAVAEFASSLIKAGKIKAFSDLDSYLKKGKAGVAEFFAFVEQYAQKTKGAVNAQSQTLFANFNRLKNAYRDFLENFAKGGTTTGLSKVVDQLIGKLQGDSGAKFAHELADAFVFIAKGVSYAIDHIDALIILLKGFIALNIVKGIVGIGSGFLMMGVNAYNSVAKIVAFTKAARAARIAQEELTLAQRGMMVLAGPVGVALAVVAAAFYGMERAEHAANKELDDYAQNLKNVSHLQGKNLLGAVHARNNDAHDVEQQINDAKAQIAKIRRLGLDNAVNQGLERTADQFRDPANVQSIKSLTERIAQLTEMHKGLTAAVVLGSKRYIQSLKDDAAAAAADNAQKDHFVDASSPDKSGSDAAAKKEEARLARLAALAERRKDIEDKANTAVLNMDEALANAQMDVDTATSESIQKNLALRIAGIGDEIEKKRIALMALKNDAEHINDPAAAAAAQAAADKLPLLQEALIKQAQYKAANDDIKTQEENINALIATRDARIAAVNTKVQLGILSEEEGRQAVFDIQQAASSQIISDVNTLIATLEALKASNPSLAAALHVDETIAKLQQTNLEAGKLQTTVQLIGKNLGGQFSQGVATAFGTFIKGMTGGIEGVHGFAQSFQAAKNGFLDFLADFLVGIGQAILQAILLKAIMNAINGTSGGYGKVVQGVLAGTGHTGGIVNNDGSIGHGNAVRQVSAAMFVGAKRFHKGGLPGLGNGEVPAILKKGEEVVTRDDPRNALNGGLQRGGNAGPSVDLAIHNHIDSGSMVVAGVNTKAGQKAIFNMVSANREQFKRLLA